MHEFHTQTQIYESNVLCTQIFKTTHTPGVGGGGDTVWIGSCFVKSLSNTCYFASNKNLLTYNRRRPMLHSTHPQNASPMCSNVGFNIYSAVQCMYIYTLQSKMAFDENLWFRACLASTRVIIHATFKKCKYRHILSRRSHKRSKTSVSKWRLISQG